MDVGGLARTGDALPARSLEGLDRVLLRVGVEVAHEQGRLARESGGEGRQGGGLGDADRVRVALTVPAVNVASGRALGHGSLRLEVSGDNHEGRGRGPIGGHTGELLGERLARQARERRVVVNQRGADGGHGRGLVDEGDADDILGLGHGPGRRHIRPRPGTRILVEGLDEARERRVAVRPHAHGDGVFDLLEGNHVGVQGVDRGDDLGLLVGEGLARERAAHLAFLGRHEGARAVRVALASRFVDAQVGEVVEDVERRHASVAADRGGTRALPGDGHGRTVGVPGDHGGRLKDEGTVPGLEDHGLSEGHVVADARGRAVGQVGVGGLGGGPLLQVRVGPVVEGDGAGGVGGLVVAGRLPGSDHVRGRAQRALTRGEGQGAVLVRLVVVGDGPRALGCEEHGLEGLGLVRRRDAGCRDGRRYLASLDLAHGGRGQLGEALGVALRTRRGELPHRAGHAHAGARCRDLALLARVDEEAVGTSAPRLPRATRSGCLDRVAIQRLAQPRFASWVRGRHDAESRHGGTHHRGIVTLAHGLDVGDRRIDEAGALLTRLRGARGGGRLRWLRRLHSPRLGLLGISLPPIGRPRGGHKPHRGQRERAEYS